MSRGINKVILIGNLGGDPEVCHMPNGGAVTNLTIATSQGWKDKNTGQQQERTEWHRVVFFNRLAEICGQYLRKGSKIYLEGSLRTKEWEKDGVKRYTTEIIGSEMQMLDSRVGGGDQQSGGDQSQAGSNYSPSSQQTQPQQNNQSAATAKNNPPSDSGDFEDSIPF